MKLIMLQGLPGSGKTTWAREQTARTEEPRWYIVSKDDIRSELTAGGWKWSKENEKEVIAIRDSQIRILLGSGKNVISTDTNFGKHKIALSRLATEYGAEFERKYFDVPIEECLRRNALREGEARVPDAAIWGMWQANIRDDEQHYPLSSKTQALTIKKVERVEGLPSAIICDLDGTLAINNGHRGWFDYAKADNDELCKPVYDLINLYRNYGCGGSGGYIIYLSGREEYGREATNAFLEKNHCPHGELFMRSTGDKRKDNIVKLELFDANIRGKYNVEFVLDDRDQVVKMWRELGLKCFQVAEGSF